MIIQMAIAVVIAYFIGSIPTGLWFGKYFRNIDIRDHGSGNLGATNAFRVLGKKLGSSVLLLDILKGMLPVLLLPSLVGIETASPEQELMIGIAAIVGHVFSCFVNFRGGKGVATALGVFLAIAPLEMTLILGIGVLIIAVTGYVSLASVTGAALLPIGMYLNSRPLSVLLMGTLVAVVVIIRHRSNIVRLLQGKENRFYSTNSGPNQEDQINAQVKSNEQ